MSYNRNTGSGVAGVEWLVALVFGLVGAAIGAVVMAGYLVIKTLGKVIWGGVSSAVKPVMAESRAQPVAAKPSSEIERPLERTEEVVPMASISEQYVDSFLRRVDLKGAYAAIWFYPNTGKARRSITMTSAALIKKFGRKVILDDLDVEIPQGVADVVQQTTLEAKEMIATKKKSPTTIPSETPVLSTGNSPSVTDNELKEVSPVSCAVAVPRPRKKEVAYRGLLVKHGIEARGEGGDAYKCYCLHLFDEGLGSTHQIWGTDIERAIKDAGVRDGDRIEVAQVGTTPTAGGNKKKVFSIQKLMTQKS